MATQHTKRERTKSKASRASGSAREGKVAKAIESETARLPSDLFLWSSVGAMATSLTLKLLGREHIALFIGQWAAPFLLLGIYNKIVKVQGSEGQGKTVSE
jgi:hypothetical protein